MIRTKYEIYLTKSVAYFSTPFGHCEVINKSTPLNLVSFFIGSTNAVISTELKLVLSDKIFDSVPLR